MLPEVVPPKRRVAQIIASVVFCFLLVGLVFGYAALKPVLLTEGVYAHLCKDGVGGCAEQDTRLNLLFVVATSATNVSALPLGWFLDSVGPRRATIAGAVVFAIGSLVFAQGHVGAHLDTYLLGYFLMALGAPSIFLSQFHLSNTFPARAGLILGAVTGAFDASSMPLVFFKQAYYALGGPSVHTFFTCYAIIPVLLIVQQLWFGPAEIYERVSEATAIARAEESAVDSAIAGESSFAAPHTAPGSSTGGRAANASTISWAPGYADQTQPSETTPLVWGQRESLGRRVSRKMSISRRTSRRMSSAFSRVAYDIPDDAGDDDDATRKALTHGVADPVVGAMFGKSLSEQIGSSWFWCMEFMICVHMTRINWYLATVNTQLVYYTHNPELAERLTDAFTFLLPLAGIVSVPFVGWLLDSRPTRDVALVMMAMGVAFGTLQLASTTVPQLIGTAVLVCFRPLYYTSVSDYAAKVMGMDNFGVVYGLGMTLSGLLGLGLTPLDVAVKGTLGGNYTLVNVVLLGLGVVSSAVLAARCARAPKAGVALE